MAFIVLLSLSFITIKGVSNQERSGLLKIFLRQYISEMAIFTDYLNEQAWLNRASLASFIGSETLAQRKNPVNTLQQTSLLAFNSLENNLTEFLDGEKSAQVIAYTVQEGDTLSFIASDFGVSINSIIWANNLKNINSIRPGDELKIPPVTGIIHRIKKGDTVAGLAKKYKADQEKIIAFNALSLDGSLQINDEIIIPDGQLSASMTAFSTSVLSTAGSFAYLPNLGDYFMIPTTGYNWGRVHGRNAVDIANSCGTPIYAAAQGLAAIVDGVGWNGGYGKFIKIVHPNGTETLYAHASQLLIGQGEAVERGQLVAKMGSTGQSTGCHLHFETHGAQNPLAKR